MFIKALFVEIMIMISNSNATKPRLRLNDLPDKALERMNISELDVCVDEIKFEVNTTFSFFVER